MKKNFIDLSPSELNTFLIKETGINLIFFSSLAFEVVRWKKIFPDKKLDPKTVNVRGCKGDEPEFCHRISITQQDDRQILISLRKKIVNLENKIIETMLESEILLHFEHRDKDQFINKDEFKKKFAWEYDLEDFFDILFMDKCDIDDLLALNKTGAPINRRNLLCSIWARYMIEKNKVANWKIIANLMDWFWKKLVPYEIYKDFRPTQEQTDPEYLKNQFFKQKKRWEIYYRSIMPRVYTGDDKETNFPGHIYVLGKRADQIEASMPYGMELCICGVGEMFPGKLWTQALDIYKSRANFEKRAKIKKGKEHLESMKYAKLANLNWLVIFPDGTYAIDPEKA